MGISIEELIAKVTEIDQEAAEYISNKYRHKTGLVTLDNLFVWSKSPQGHTFWSDIHYKIDYSIPILISPETKQTRVQRKIKSLWNNSNWVKANPSQAY